MENMTKDDRETRISPESDRWFELSSQQIDIYVDQMIRGTTPIYNIGVGLRIEGPLDVDALRAAVQCVVVDHRVLRSVFEQRGDTVVARVLEPRQVALPLEDMPPVSDAEQMRAVLLQPYDLSAGPLYRFALFRAGEQQHLLFVGSHHMIQDGYGTWILAQHLATTYEALLAGEPPPTPLPDYFDFVSRQRQYRQSPRFTADEAFWRAEFADLPPALFSQPACATQASDVAPQVAWILHRATYDRIHAQTAHALLTVITTYFARTRNMRRITVGVPVHSRMTRDDRSCPGPFASMLPVTMDYDGARTFEEAMDATWAALWRLYRHQNYPLSAIHRLHDFTTGQRARLFDVMLSVEEFPHPGRMGSTHHTAIPVFHGQSQVPLTINVRRYTEGGDAEIDLNYNPAFLTHTEATRMAGQMDAVLKELLASPKRPLRSFDMADTRERMQILSDFCAGAALPADPAASTPIHARFVDLAAHDPERTAVLYDDGMLSFGEVAARSARIAAHLRAAGVGPETLVGLHVERGLDMIPALLGILRAGGAFVPLDPATPDARLNTIITDARPALILTHFAPLASATELGIPSLDVQALLHAVPSPDAGVDAPCAPDQLAYVLYTSGSTGTPKGVMVEHRNLTHLLWALNNAIYAHHPNARRVGVNASMAFDASIKQIIQIAAGRTLVLVPQRARLDPIQLGRYLVRTSVDVIDITPQQLVAAAATEGFASGGWPRVTLIGGEEIDAQTWTRVCAHSRSHDAAFYNLYGPTECTVDATCARIGEGPEAAPHIGRPLPGVRVYILDLDGRIAPIGAVGELCIAGGGVARGYRGLPERTAERFVSDPWHPTPGGRMYRTGDLAGWNADGSITYLGRTDAQIKIRGHRIEPGEIEARLTELDGVRQAVVVTEPDAAGQPRLIAYVTADAPATEVDTRSLRHALETVLPQAMIPAQLVAVDAFPLTANGKIDRRALPRPPAVGQDDDPAPRDALETALWSIWSEVLGLANFGIRSSFFELGGHSLLITQVASRIRDRIGAEISIAELFGLRTIADIAEHLRETADAPRHDVLPPILPVPRGQPLPVSFSQRRMWVIQQFDPTSTAYNVPVTLLIRGKLDADCLQQAIDDLVRRHEGLRTCFVLQGGEPMQSIAPTLRVPMQRIDLRHLPAESREGEARRLLSREFDLPFDLAVAPLHRLYLLQLDDGKHVLSWIFHHAIADNWATPIMLRDLLHAYGRRRTGREPEWPPMAMAYADYAAWQRSPRVRAAGQEQMNYWLDRLRGLHPLQLPTDHPPPAQRSSKGHQLQVEIPPRILARLDAFCSHASVTPYVVFLAAFKLLLWRLSGDEDLAVGSPIANRHRLATEHLFGTLVNTLVMRTQLEPLLRFEQWVQRVRDTALGAFAHQDTSFDDLVERLGLDRAMHAAGPVRVLFNLRNAPLGTLPPVDLDYARFETDRVAAQFDLSMHIDTEIGKRIHLEYALDLFTRATAEQLLDAYLWVVESALAHPERPLNAFWMASPAMMDRQRAYCRGPERPIPEEPLHRDLARHVAQQDGASVTGPDGTSMTHAALLLQSHQIARMLRARGIGRGDRVGLCLHRGTDMLAAMLGVLESGAAYVPLDPDYPRERLNHMAADAELAAVLMHADLHDRFDLAGQTAIDLDADAPWKAFDAAALPADPSRDAGPRDAAYMIYTSGSTGQPKGVAVPHGAVINFLGSMASTPGLGVGDTLVAVTTLSFDIAVLELLLPLATGADLVIASAETARDPFALRTLLESTRANVLQATPSTWRLLLDAGWNGHAAMRGLVGGEALPADLAQRLLDVCPQLWNMYGPTETTVWSTCWKVNAADLPVRIGQPIANTSVWVLDACGSPCPTGIPGEIHIGGSGVALSYWKRPELTAERFIPDPFDAAPTARLYRTGDLGKWGHDGQLLHLGRLDHQVKVRGFRIELGEIESVLLEQPGVRQALVTTYQNDPADVRIVAYLLGTDPDTDLAQLRSRLQKRLPEYMLPQHVVWLAAFPLQPNGKVDRNRLPPPSKSERDPQGQAPASGDAPETPEELAIADIWQGLLRVEEIRRHDNFFDLGGHSLLAMQAVVAIDKRLGLRIAPQRLIYESLAQLARVPSVTEMDN